MPATRLIENALQAASTENQDSFGYDFCGYAGDRSVIFRIDITPV